MIKERTIEISPVVSVAPALFYFPFQFRKDVEPNFSHRNQWGIMCSWQGADGSAHFDVHRGRFTGNPVAFSRYSDAKRLCSSLNDSSCIASSHC